MHLNTQYHSSNQLKLSPFLQNAFQKKDLSVLADTKERLLRILTESHPYIYTSDTNKKIYSETLRDLEVVKEAILLLGKGD